MMSLIPQRMGMSPLAARVYSSLRTRHVATMQKIRDPNRPKLPLTPFFRFAEAYRKEQKLKGGTETMKKIAVAWKALPAEKKKPHETAAQTERAKYEEAFKKYKNSGALDAWKRDPAKPKLPMSPYLRYLDEFRASEKAKNLKSTEVLREGAKAWKTVDQAKKKTWEAAFKRDQEAYAKAMKEYKDSGKELAWKKKVGIYDQEQKLAAKKAAAAEKERQAKLKLRLREKARKDREKEKMAKGKAKEKAKLLREKALTKAKLAKEKEKEKLARAKGAEAGKLKKAKATQATKSKLGVKKKTESKEKASAKLQQEKQKKEATKLKLMLAEENRKYKERMVKLQKQISTRMSRMSK